MPTGKEAKPSEQYRQLSRVAGGRGILATNFAPSSSACSAQLKLSTTSKESQAAMKHDPSMRFLTCLTCLVPCFNDLSCPERCGIGWSVGNDGLLRIRVLDCWAVKMRTTEFYCDCCRIVTRTAVKARRIVYSVTARLAEADAAFLRVDGRTDWKD
jgi:hypothetical protein